MPIVECVPNFSEGRDRAVIDQITGAISQVDGCEVLDVDPGAATNRTVVTVVGEPDAVVEGAFQGIKKASELIDMSKHTGEHPRMGATDVCPFIPVADITMEECAKRLHISRRTLQELVKRHPYYMEAGRRKLFAKIDFERLQEALRCRSGYLHQVQEREIEPITP